MAKITVEIESRCLYPSDEQTVSELFDLIGLCEYGDDVETGNDFDVILRSDSSRFKNNIALNGSGLQSQTDQREAVINGTRTSATEFTRTAGTWVVNALVGYRVWVYVDSAPDAGEWFDVRSNTATVITVNSGPLLTACDRIKLQAKALLRHLVQLTPQADFYGSFFQYKVTKKIATTGVFKWFGVKGNSIPRNIDPEFFAGMGVNSNGWEA
jgi:hypothetical protein